MRRTLLAVLAAVALPAAACETLEAHKKRLAGDPLVVRSKKVASVSPGEAARRAVESITADDERALGEAVSLRILAAHLAKGGAGLELRDRTLLAYVNHVGNLVALQGRREVFPPATKPRTNARRFVFGILDTDEPGAWSTPGGYVFVSRGLLARLGSESELAWVLAHEVAHVDLEHGLAMLKADLKTRAALGAIGDAFRDDGTPREAKDPFEDPAFFNAVADRFWDVYEGTGLARDTELRADAKGLEYATAAGYDGQGAARALEALQPDTGGGIVLGRQLGDSINRVLTHGSKRERLAAMAAFLEKPGRTGAARYDRVAAARVEQLLATAPGAASAPGDPPAAAPAATPPGNGGGP